MEAQIQTESKVYKPSIEQQERAKTLRRFNWLAVFLPLGLVSLAVLILIAFLLWGVLSPNIIGTREFASSLADIIIILTVLPLLFLCAIVPLAAIGLLVYRRQQPKPEYGRLQPLFWRLDSLLIRTREKTGAILPKLATPIISGYGWMSYLKTYFNRLKSFFSRR